MHMALALERVALPYTRGMLEQSPAAPQRPLSRAALAQWWRTWWRSLSPVRQDRFAALAPLAAVLIFMAAIVAAFWYLRVEEGEREQEALRRDIEYAQQRVRLRLLERQEQIMRIARSRASVMCVRSKISHNENERHYLKK